MTSNEARVLFPTEAALCAAFSAWAQSKGWTPYPETGGFDILLVAADGTQVGVQAKLRFNIKVLEQLVPDCYYWRDERIDADYRAVLTPQRGNENLCDALGVTSMYVDTAWYRPSRAVTFSPGLPNETKFSSHYGRWHWRCPDKRIELPNYVPDVVAGASGPSQLTKWKEAALAIAAVLELRGFVTRRDFQREGIDYRRWTQDWLLPGADRGQWITGPRTPDFAKQHPVVYPQVRAKVVERLAAEKDLAA